VFVQIIGEVKCHYQDSLGQSRPSLLRSGAIGVLVRRKKSPHLRGLFCLPVIAVTTPSAAASTEAKADAGSAAVVLRAVPIAAVGSGRIAATVIRRWVIRVANHEQIGEIQGL
jgi:hypothetical protein